MKRFIVILAALAVAVAFASPAMADLKLTTKGYMDVTGIYAKENIRDISATVPAESSNAWYQMEAVIDPVLHINDKVRIVSRITIMERYMGGAATATNAAAEYRSESAGGNDFWWEWFYLEAVLGPGTLAIGRMSGGQWAYDFQDTAANRDRIKYTTKLGHVTLVGLIEKLAEVDGGGSTGYLTAAPVAGGSWTQSSSDYDAYAVGAVIPLSKAIVYRPLFYYLINDTGANNSKDNFFLNGLGLNFGSFKLDMEVNYRWSTNKEQNQVPFGGTGTADIEAAQFSGWAEGTFNLGAAQIGLGLFYLQGEDDANGTNNPERNNTGALGGEFQPTLLLFSEDIGLLWNTSGVANGSTIGRSGYEAAYLKAGFKLSDSMMIRAIFMYLNASEMLEGSKTGGGVADDHIGMELDLGFEWQLLPNLKYVFEAGYLQAGDYWNDTDGDAVNDLSNDPWGCRHMMVITW